jgi:hypothetical protein
MTVNADELRERILGALRSQGFSLNPHLKPENNEKDTLKLIHMQKRREQLKLHRRFLVRNFRKVKEYSVSGEELEPSKIRLELIEVPPESFHSRLFFWWNLVWWSIPYDKPIGRQMRFILWDKAHDSPFGMFYLQSPPLRSAVRDEFLGLDRDQVDYWINQSLYGQRIGALPPYNQLLGGKMVCLSMTSDEVREAYARKYKDRKTLLRERELPNRLLFISTTSAYGKSSVYERVKFKDEVVSQFIGYTSGSGTFHLPEILYKECLQYLKEQGISTRRGYGTGPSRKLKLISVAFRLLGIGRLTHHNIKRGYYILPNVKNLHGVIHDDQVPIWHDRPFKHLERFWLNRWCIPRSDRVHEWKNFDSKDYFNKIEREINRL